LKVELHRAFRLPKIADRHVLAKIEVEVPAACREDDAALDRAPDNLLINEALHVLEDGITVVVAAGDGGVGFRTEQERVGAIDACKA
jgi:hypothetical protein